LNGKEWNISEANNFLPVNFNRFGRKECDKQKGKTSMMSQLFNAKTIFKKQTNY
jgi:hypothetical protein